MSARARGRTILGRGSWAESARVATVLRKETVGGALLLGATVLALVWANSPYAGGYVALRDHEVGPSALHLHLSLGSWASDGLLAIFFFVVGLELKREFVAGDLRDPRRAALPILAAAGGMVAPALVYVAVNLGTGGEALRGWAIPTATDIAFALAVLAVAGAHLPSALRTFLLTLAVVDDLFAVSIIAVFYTRDLHLLALLAAVPPLLLFTLAVQRRVRSWWLLLPLAALTWGFVHASGVHATVAGVLLGFAVPVLRSGAAGGPEAGPGLAEHLEHRFRPLSAGVAVPVFAFFASGVAVGGISGLGESLTDRVTLGIVVALVGGKFVGVALTTYLVARFTGADLDPSLRWLDVFGVALLAGIGFTVSLLIGELAFGPTSLRDQHVKVGILTGTLVASALAAAVLRWPRPQRAAPSTPAAKGERVAARISAMTQAEDSPDIDVPDLEAGLPDGRAMPLLGFGTWQITGREARTATETALEVGYRHLDTATVYRNEAEVGRALADSGLAREDVFVTTKCPPDRAGRELDTLRESLEQLQSEYVDLWLIHWPPDEGPGTDIWRAFIEARELGLARDIGVSNYSTAQVDQLTKETGAAPAVNQIEWSPLLFDAAVLEEHRERGVVLEGYSGLRGGVLENPTILDIARQTGRTPAQVVIRWHLQHDVVVIPKSRQPERIRSNADVGGFSLSDDQMAALDGLASGT